MSIASRVAKERARDDGFGSNEKAFKFMKQDYEALKEECLQCGKLFEDKSFPAVPSTVGFKELGPTSKKTRGIEWKRPMEIVSDPQFIIGGATRTDICQGALGDCWLLAAIASITLNEQIMSRVVPPDQSFTDSYAGIFHFQFWQFGDWYDVVIDDRLPTKDGELLFVHSKEKNEFWPALLEKAYAKMNGSYEALAGGSTTEGFEDFTGGVSEWFDLKKAPSNLFQIIKKSLKTGSLLGCSIDITNAAETEGITFQKLVKGHAYSLTGAEEVIYRGRPEKLVRMRNPWGTIEWTGAWSDNAPEWNSIDAAVKDRLVNRCDDGEFWMSFTEFLRHFSRLEICSLTPDALSSDKYSKWSLTQHHSSWRRGANAGGCANHTFTFWTNPQFRLVLDEADDDPDDNEVGCTFVINLLQKNRRKEKKMGEDMQTIGYAIYEVPPELENSQLRRDFFASNKSATRSETFINLRDITCRHKLPPGHFVIVPSTFEPNKNADFCLRVFSEKQATAQQMGEEIEANIVTPEISEDDIDPNFKHVFERISGEDQQISALEMRNILNTVLAKRTDIKTDGFTLPTCTEILLYFDKDGSGKLGIVEFKMLWTKIENYLQVYKKVDLDRSGTMSCYEMRGALEEIGIKLNTSLYSIIAARYSDDDLLVDFDNFIRCVFRLEAMFEAFKYFDVENSGTIELSLGHWLFIGMM
ncbi:calpain-2 catalytic subunit isoform X2 [Protopterus annectens]|uniref:calpain-2 catalytic subunit isoform X2 n=1 Tax=Protopterus annectens TaxID=7888 RepID=UPI001CFB930F|nr:calpain-2 catalytic subunit isoform X2 [Protopterus annectens]